MTTGSATELLEGAESQQLVVGPAEIAARSPLELFWRRLREDKVALVALGVISFLIVVALTAPLIVEMVGAPKPSVQNSKALDEFGSAAAPSRHNLLGTDDVGRDVFSRVVYGTRVSLTVAILATGIALILGVAAGLYAGFYRGWIDSVLSRSMDVILAFPVLLFAIGVGFACNTADGCVHGLLKPGISTVVFVIVIPTFPYFARIVRGQVLSLREREFVEAARSLGASGPRIMFREILPNLVAPLIVYATLIIPANILFEAALSFLGVGIKEPNPSWGAMIADAAPIFDSAWWYMLFPGLALLTTVLSFNLLGDGLQDALNPRTSK
ncbi:MAG: peptide/nickel transport system permease protein [Thermoleophilales bacterium]|nr:peptide/nickel transport system permease protein [Thermoleophilales bacterium]